MTVAELRELMEEAPEDMEVMIMVQSEGIFGFAHPCPNEVGVITLGPEPDSPFEIANNPEGYAGKKVFCIAPHMHEYDEEDEEKFDVSNN